MTAKKPYYDGSHGRAIGDANRKMVWDFKQKNPNASGRRIADAIGLSHNSTLKALKAIEAGWTPASMGEKK